jgi:hypothetical protein
MRYFKYSIVLLFALRAVSAMGQAPSGTFTYVFTNAPLWDPTGVFTNTIDTNGIVDHVIVDLTAAANGSVTGERQDDITEVTDEGTDTANVNGTISGKISGKGGAPSGKLKEAGTVTGVFEGHDYTGTAKGSSTVTLEVSSITNVVTVGSLKISPKGGKSVTFTGDDSSPVTNGANGNWTLDTDVIATVDKLSGTATLTLDSGRAFNYEITGTYSASSGASKLKLVGGTNAIGSSISLTTTGTNMDLTALKGKVLGQTPTIP